MRWWPFVSRDRFDDERARAVKAETALEALRVKFLEYIEHQQTLPVIGEDTDLSKIQPIAGRPTIANVISFANAGAYKRAQTYGAKGVSEELAEAQDRMTKIKRKVNGN
jgi:hypothetical protein